MKKIDRRIVVVAAFVFIVGISYGLMEFLIAQKEVPRVVVPPSSRRIVKVEEIEYKTINSPVVAPGRLSSVAKIDMVAEASGKISTSGISLKKGASFNKGDVLFTIYRDEAVLNLKARKSLFLNTLANTLPEIRIDFPDEEKIFMHFFLSIGIDDPLPDFPALNDDKLKIFLASRNVLSEYYSIKKDELQLTRHTVSAPFQGTYSDVYIEEGAYANTGGRVATAIQLDRLELEVPVKKSDAAFISPGDNVTLSRGNESHKWVGRVIRKGRFVDEETQSQAIFIAIPNNQETPLMPGEYLSAEFPGYPIPDAFEIPRNIVFNSDEIFIVNEERLIKKRLNIIKINERTLIANGLDEGSWLVIQPLINVQEGTPVDVLGERLLGGDEGKPDPVADNLNSQKGDEK